jgi:hypothetical protein
MIVMIVAICVIGDIIKERKNTTLDESEELIKNRSLLLYRLKVRVENLETIVLEKERNRRFAELEKN